MRLILFVAKTDADPKACSHRETYADDSYDRHAHSAMNGTARTDEQYIVDHNHDDSESCKKCVVISLIFKKWCKTQMNIVHSDSDSFVVCIYCEVIHLMLPIIESLPKWMETIKGRRRTFYVTSTSIQILIKVALWLDSTEHLIDIELSFTIEFSLRLSRLNPLKQIFICLVLA